LVIFYLLIRMVIICVLSLYKIQWAMILQFVHFSLCLL
jgi:hypothetical protein